MKSILLILALLWFATTQARSQNNEVVFNDYTGFKANAIYVEGFIMNSSDYNYGYPTLNYERYLDKLYRLSFRIGISSDFDKTINIPFSINWLTASLKNHHLEFGAGTIISINDYTYEDNNLVAYGVFVPLMYRYQKAGGLIIRAGANMVFGLDKFVAPSVSIGYNF